VAPPSVPSSVAPASGLKRKLEELTRADAELQVRQQKLESEIDLNRSAMRRVKKKLDRYRLFEELPDGEYHVISPYRLFGVTLQNEVRQLYERLRLPDMVAIQQVAKGIDDGTNESGGGGGERKVEKKKEVVGTAKTDVETDLDDPDILIAKFRALYSSLSLAFYKYGARTNSIVGGRGAYHGGWAISEVDFRTVAHLEFEEGADAHKEAIEESSVDESYFNHVYESGDTVDEEDFDPGTLDWTGGGDHKGFYGTASIKKLVFVIKCRGDEEDEEEEAENDSKEEEEGDDEDAKTE
jgi:hypothetical protein